MKFRILLLIICLGVSESLLAAINWSESVSANAVIEDFEGSTEGVVPDLLSITGGTAGEHFSGQTVATDTDETVQNFVST